MCSSDLKVQICTSIDGPELLHNKQRILAGGNAYQESVKWIRRINKEYERIGLDPVLSQNRERAGFARIGDLLLEAKRFEAALIEYEKAMPPDEPPSPALSERKAEALVGLGKTKEAIAVLRASIDDYPEIAATRKRLAGLLLAQGDTAGALVQFRASADTNPFDPEVQQALAHLYTAAGKTELAQRHARYKRILDLGGETLDKDGADG